MKSIGAGLLTHIQSDLSTLATCWKITRQDATVLGFTSHVEDLVVSGVTYQAETGAYAASAIRSTSDLAVDNLDLQVMIHSSAITEADLVAGRYDHAAVEIFAVNYKDLTQGAIKLRKGWLGEIRVGTAGFEAELRGMMQPLQQTIGRVYAKRCDADLGDTRCAVALAGITITGTVSSITSRRVFVVSNAPARPGGKLTWTSGLNNGLAMEVQNVSGTTVTLNLPMPFDVAATDAYSVYPGCDKNLSTCRDTFNNVVNFRGFPFIPGPDDALRYPDAR